jgi:hypothetical protein
MVLGAIKERIFTVDVPINRRLNIETPRRIIVEAGSLGQINLISE